MKKWIALLLSIVLLVSCTAALAEGNAKKTLGTISINGAFSLQCALPDGYRVVPRYVSNDQVIASVVSDDNTKPEMFLSVAFDELYSDVERMNDLDDEAMAVIEQSFYSVDPTIDISYDETAYGTRLLIAKQVTESYNYVDFLSVYKGYFVEFVVTAGQGAEEKTLTDEQIQMCINFLSELDFVPVQGTEGTGVDVAGKQFTAVLGAYDESTNTLQVTIEEPVEVEKDYVEAFAVGETVLIGSEELEVTQLEKKDDTIVVNDEYYLTPAESGNYHASFYDSMLLHAIAKLTIPVESDLVFQDDIDPESLEMLDEPLKYTAAEFLEILQNPKSTDPGFAADNVKVTFDESGRMTAVERLYVPWQ